MIKSAHCDPQHACELTLRIPPPPHGLDAWASLAAGVYLVAAGLRGRSILRLPALGLGGWLLARGVSGLYEPAPPASQPSAGVDPLDEGLEETFPASDPVSVSSRRRY